MALILTMTNIGLARFTAAQLGNGADLRISSVGITDNAIVVAPTLTALPGEFRRIDTISGAQVGNNIVHLVVRDDALLNYGFRAFGLYLSDGTLFAVYGQADRIMQKSSAAANLFAIDIAFPAANVASVSFGDTNFLNPPATTETKGVVEIATDAEAIAGIEPLLAVSPKGLAARLASILTTIAGLVAQTRRVNTTGLATGGRALDGDVTVDVPAASAAEADAAVNQVKALTPASLVNILATIGARVQQTRRVNTSGLATGGAALSADVTIAVPAASAAEADAGVSQVKALTPASLVNVLASILARVPLTRRIDTSGLAIGGNALNTDITISVPPATAAQLLAGTASNVAATPAALAAAGVVYLVESKSDGTNRYRRFSDGSVEMMGIGSCPVTERAFAFAFPWPFPTACDGIWSTTINSAQSDSGAATIQEVSLTAAGATLFIQSHGASFSDAAGGFRWFARGR